MPKEKQTDRLCVDNLRYSEYYGMQDIFDDLYAKSKNNEKFADLLSIILQQENILLAYRSIKTNQGSKTPGTDKLTIDDIAKLTPEEVVNKVRYIINGSKHGYRPKPVRRKDIPKPNGSTRPLGIPCIWDRLIQQCIKQVLEPICEAKFSNNSFGFRPNRSMEQAIQSTYRLIQNSNLHYVVEFDIKSFFDNVNHSKLIKQIWAMGIRDKHLIYILKQILTAPIKMPNGDIMKPIKGTPQGGIISPLLANIVLNELDHWVESQWQTNPVIYKYSIFKNKAGREIYSNGYKAMRRTNLKEMHIVRYADDFRIFCRKKSDAQKALISISQWLQDRLKLEISPEKTKVVNVKRRYMDFLGFKIKVYPKNGKYTVTSHVNDKQLQKQREKLVEQAKRIAKPSKGKSEIDEVRLYNSMVMGVQNYYKFATLVNSDFKSLNRAVMTVLTNRLHTKGRGSRFRRVGRKLTPEEFERYGKTDRLRFLAESEEPIYPIGHIQHMAPMAPKWTTCQYTIEGRKGLHENLRVNTPLMLKMMRQPLHNRTVEYADNRISLFSAQWGKCAVTGKEFQTLEDIHCHHKTPKYMGGNDKYENLILVLKPIHFLIHATEEETIEKYKNLLNLDIDQIQKVNELRIEAGLKKIA